MKITHYQGGWLLEPMDSDERKVVELFIIALAGAFPEGLTRELFLQTTYRTNLEAILNRIEEGDKREGLLFMEPSLDGEGVEGSL